MIGQQVFARSWFSHGAKVKSPGTWTAAISDNIFENQAEAIGKLDAICRVVPESIALANSGQSLLQLHHPYPDTSVVTRSWFVTDVITGRGIVAYSHSLIFTGSDNDSLLANAERAMSAEAFEPYQDFAGRTNANPDVPSSLNPAKTHGLLDGAAAVFTRADWGGFGFNRDLFSGYLSALIKAIGSRTGEKVAVTLPANIEAERFILATLNALPSHFKRKFAAASSWTSDFKSLKGVQLVCIPPGTVPNENHVYVDVTQNRISGFTDAKVSFSNWLWDNLDDGNAIKSFENNLLDLVGSRVNMDKTTRLKETEDCFTIISNCVVNAASCDKEVVVQAIASSFAGAMNTFPKAQTYIDIMLKQLIDSGPQQIAKCSPETQKAVLRLLEKESGNSAVSYTYNALYFLMMRILTSCPDAASATKILLSFEQATQNREIAQLINSFIEKLHSHALSGGQHELLALLIPYYSEKLTLPIGDAVQANAYKNAMDLVAVPQCRNDAVRVLSEYALTCFSKPNDPRALPVFIEVFRSLNGKGLWKDELLFAHLLEFEESGVLERNIQYDAELRAYFAGVYANAFLQEFPDNRIFGTDPAKITSWYSRLKRLGYYNTDPSDLGQIINRLMVLAEVDRVAESSAAKYYELTSLKNPASANLDDALLRMRYWLGNIQKPFAKKVECALTYSYYSSKNAASVEKFNAKTFMALMGTSSDPKAFVQTVFTAAKVECTLGDRERVNVILNALFYNLETEISLGALGENVEIFNAPDVLSVYNGIGSSGVKKTLGELVIRKYKTKVVSKDTMSRLRNNYIGVAATDEPADTGLLPFALLISSLLSLLILVLGVVLLLQVETKTLSSLLPILLIETVILLLSFALRPVLAFIRSR